MMMLISGICSIQMDAGHGSPNNCRRSSGNARKLELQHHSGTIRLPFADMAAVRKNENGPVADSRSPNSGCDSSSELSDEGYRTGGLGVGTKLDDSEERPGSSCTQVSQSSSAESGVSSFDVVAESQRALTTRSNSVHQQSRIPFLGSLRGLGKLSFQQQRNKNNINNASADESLLVRRNSRSDSITSEGSPSSGGASSSSLRRNNFGRRSLRAQRGSEGDTSRPRIMQQQSITSSHYTSTWGGGRNKKERPALSADLFNGSDQQPLFTSSGSERPNHSRLINNSVSKVQSRGASVSPVSRRRYFGTSVTSTPNSPEVGHRGSPFNWNNKQSPVAPLAADLPSNNKLSPLLRNMLKDVDIDNDESILKKMEEIVNQYKLRVEGILAAEGKTLNGELEPTRCNPYFDKPDGNSHLSSPSSSANQCRLSRRNSFDSSLSGFSVGTHLYSPRKDIASPSPPSKIPVPLFYRPKETCL